MKRPSKLCLGHQKPYPYVPGAPPAERLFPVRLPFLKPWADHAMD